MTCVMKFPWLFASSFAFGFYKRVFGVVRRRVGSTRERDHKLIHVYLDLLW